MKTMNATDAKNKVGQLIDEAQAGPVAIQKNGRDVAVLVSKEEYERGKKNAVNARALQLHEDSIRKFGASYRRMAE